MEPRIEVIESKKLIGMHITMSLSDNKTAQLWQKFMPGRGEVVGRLNSKYISMQVYNDDVDAKLFSPETMFDKWAAVEVENSNNIPEGMELYTISGGKYAVFVHKGPAGTFPETMQYIFGKWLPGSKYKLDNREHFEILAENYRPDDPEAEEEVWIPIR